MGSVSKLNLVLAGVEHWICVYTANTLVVLW